LQKPLGKYAWRVIAVGNSLEIIEHDWRWIENNLIPMVSSLETQDDVEIFFTSKFESLSSKYGKALLSLAPLSFAWSARPYRRLFYPSFWITRHPGK